jgi:hypothetical protein
MKEAENAPRLFTRRVLAGPADVQDARANRAGLHVARGPAKTARGYAAARLRITASRSPDVASRGDHCDLTPNQSAANPGAADHAGLARASQLLQRDQAASEDRVIRWVVQIGPIRERKTRC